MITIENDILLVEEITDIGDKVYRDSNGMIRIVIDFSQIRYYGPKGNYLGTNAILTEEAVRDQVAREAGAMKQKQALDRIRARRST